MFTDVLRALGHPETGLIEQTEGGLLLLGQTGERLVEHYSFYAVFKTPEEYRLVSNGRDLGTLPIDNILSPGMMLIFSGRRWLVQEIHDREKVILVKPAKAGVPPVFGGDPGEIHDKVIARMFDVLESDTKPLYMDDKALEMLEEARLNYTQMGFADAPLVKLGEETSIIATRVGTMKTTTLALALRSFGFSVEQFDGFLEVGSGDETPSLTEVLKRIGEGEDVDLFADAGNLLTEKFHPYLIRGLLELDAVSSRLEPRALTTLARAFVSQL
jgi:ATP-dependent Lhr-like helicase